MDRRMMYSRLATLSGENITAENCKGAKMDFSLLGKSTQKTMTGKNLVNPETVQEVSYTSISGTATTRNGLFIDTPGTYTASAYFAQTGQYIYLLVLDENNVGVVGTNAYFITNADTSVVTRTVEPGQKLMLYDALGGHTVEYTKQLFKDFKIQIEQGSTATEFEPYIGGYPMPSPENPSPVVHAGNGGLLPPAYQQVEYLESTGGPYLQTAISGDATWELTAQSTNVSLTRAGILVAMSDYGGNWFGQTSDGYWGAGGNSIATVGAAEKVNIVASFDAEAIKVSGAVNGEAFERTGTNTIDRTPYRLMAWGTYTFVGKLFSARCAQNDVVVGEFVPCYRKADGKPGLYDMVSGTFLTNAGTGEFAVGADVGEITVTVEGANLFNMNEVQDGFVSQTAPGEIFTFGASTAYPKSQYVKIPVVPGATIHFKSYKLNAEVYRIRFAQADGITSTSLRYSNYDGFVIPENTYWIYFLAYSTGFTENASKVWLSVSAPAPAAYEPYHEPYSVVIPCAGGLPGLPDMDWQDELVINRDGTGKYIQRMKYVEFNGTEAWSAYASIPMHYQLTVNDNKFFNYAALIYIMSNYYPGEARYAMAAADYGAFSADGSRLRFKDKDVATVEDWKAKLAAWAADGKPLYAWYALATPIETDLTPEQVLYTLTGTNLISNDSGAGMRAVCRVR